MGENEDGKKLVAKDGTQRGLARRGKKNRRTELLEEIQRAVERDTGIRNWDPVVMMAVVAARSFAGYPACDSEGRPILNEHGEQVMVPPDPALAVAAAAKVAPYLHQQLRPKEVESDEDMDKDPEDTRQKVLEAFRNMGVEVKDEDPPG